MVIAIDGPAASGKGTLARALAEHLGFHYLDTGSLYRAVGLTVLRQGGDPSNTVAATKAAENLDLNGIEDADLRTAEVGEAASKVATIQGVRDALFDFQRKFAAREPGTILDGRDIGTVVCPDADVKLYVSASAKTRAKRRFLELSGKGEPVTEESVLADVIGRDRRDTERDAAPMKPADDAHLLDTSDLSIEAAFRAALAIVEGAPGK